MYLKITHLTNQTQKWFQDRMPVLIVCEGTNQPISTYYKFSEHAHCQG